MPVNPISLANLRPCSSTHQPKVRVKRGASPFTTIKKHLTKLVNAPDPFTREQTKLAIGEVVGLQWLVKAFKGDAEAIKDILDRVDGKVKTNGNNHNIITSVIIKIEGADGDKISASQAQSVASFQR